VDRQSIAEFEAVGEPRYRAEPQTCRTAPSCKPSWPDRRCPQSQRPCTDCAREAGAVDSEPKRNGLSKADLDVSAKLPE
jgi:hypothetical protein